MMVFTGSASIEEQELAVVALAAPSATERPVAELEFIEKLRERDAAAFEVLVSDYSHDVYSLLYRLTGDPDEAADLTQETFLNAVRFVSKFRAESGLRTWLFRIAVNESRNRHRWWKRRRRDKTVSLDAAVAGSELVFADTLADPGATPEQNLLASERSAALSKAVSQLPEVFREAVTLCDIHGLSYEETAEATGVNIGTVRSRISRGRSELRRLLQNC